MNKESTANIESLKPTIVLVLDNLEELYRAQGQYAKAKPLYHRALAILEKAPGPEHPDMGVERRALMHSEFSIAEDSNGGSQGDVTRHG